MTTEETFAIIHVRDNGSFDKGGDGEEGEKCVGSRAISEIINNSSCRQIR